MPTEQQHKADIRAACVREISTMADLGFLEGVTLGTRASVEGVWAYRKMKFERCELGRVHD